jgi:hypothetical protein
MNIQTSPDTLFLTHKHTTTTADHDNHKTSFQPMRLQPNSVSTYEAANITFAQSTRFIYADKITYMINDT